jgi:hypothetical protein
VTCVDVPEIQLGARGALIDFLFVTKAADGTDAVVPLTDALFANGETFALFRKPRPPGLPAEVVKVPLAIADAAAGRARYTTADGFLDLAGEWSAQGFVHFGPAPGSFIPSAVVVFRVLPNLRPFSFAPTVEPEPAELAVETQTPTVS